MNLFEKEEVVREDEIVSLIRAYLGNPTLQTWQRLAAAREVSKSLIEGWRRKMNSVNSLVLAIHGKPFS